MRLWRVEGLNHEDKWVGIAHVAGMWDWHKNTDVERDGYMIMKWLALPDRQHCSSNTRFWFSKTGVKRFIEEDLPVIRRGGFKIRWFCVVVDNDAFELDEYQWIRKVHDADSCAT